MTIQVTLLIVRVKTVVSQPLPHWLRHLLFDASQKGSASFAPLVYRLKVSSIAGEEEEESQSASTSFGTETEEIIVNTYFK